MNADAFARLSEITNINEKLSESTFNPDFA
jgi:hypothetical protein